MKYLGIIFLVFSIAGCQYENEEDLYYSGESADSLNAGLVAYFPLDGDYNDTSGNNCELSAFGDPGFAEGFRGVPSTAIILDGIDDFLIAFIGKLDTFSISMWILSNIRFAYENPQLQAVFFDYSNKEVYGYIDGISGATEVHCGVNSSTITSEDMGEVKDTWYHIYIGVTDEVELYINGRLRKIEPFEDTLNYWSDIIYFGRASYDDDMANTFFSGILDEIKVYNRILNPVEIRELSMK